MTTIELKTKRLTLRTYLPGDEAQIHEYAGDSSITMMYWLPNQTFEETAEYVQKSIRQREEGSDEVLDFVIIYDGKIVGGINLHFEENHTASIGWVLNKNYRGFGICTEAAIALRDYGFNECGVTKLYADCDARNTASANVMKKLGMQLVDDKGTRTYPKTGETAVEHTYEMTKLAEPDFTIVDYFEMTPEQQAKVIHQLEARSDLWGAIPFIINCLKKEGTPKVSPTDGGFHDLLGPGRLFLMIDENNSADNFRLAAFTALVRNDEVDIFTEGREAWTPWISCVFTYPEYRGHRLSEKLISHAEKYAVKEFKAEYTYISTDHIGLYEKFGYEFFTECETVWGENTRVLRKKLKAINK